MASPFPGMDPFLEDNLWPDVHNGLAFIIKEQLAPRVSPKYLVQTNTYTVEDTSPEDEVGIMYPDVEILSRNIDFVREPAVAYGRTSSVVTTPPTLVAPEFSTIEVKVPFVEIKDRKNNRLITAIEILSPVNKRGDGLKMYREKRERLYSDGVHLLEIDLLRRGRRPFKNPYLPTSHYFVNLVRAGSAKAEIWAIDVKDSLPTVPVPLKKPDPDTFLELGAVLRLLYERSLYHLAIDYSQTPPPPAFSPDEQRWMKDLLKSFIRAK